MNRLPHLTDDEFDGTLLNALCVAADKFKENARELRAAADTADPRNQGVKHHYRQLAEQFDKQESECRALIEKLQEETTDA